MEDKRMLDDRMKNPRAIDQVIQQAKKIEENNFSNLEYTTSISMLLNSNDLARPKDKELSEKFNRLNKQIEDINQLTSDLLNDLTSRHN